MCPRFPIDFDTYRREAARLRREARLSLVRQAAQWIAAHATRMFASIRHPAHGRGPALAGRNPAGG